MFYFNCVFQVHYPDGPTMCVVCIYLYSISSNDTTVSCRFSARYLPYFGLYNKPQPHAANYTPKLCEIQQNQFSSISKQ